MPEPHADTSTAVASTYEGTVRLGIGAPSVLAPRGVVNPAFSWRKTEIRSRGSRLRRSPSHRA